MCGRQRGQLHKVDSVLPTWCGVGSRDVTQAFELTHRVITRVNGKRNEEKKKKKEGKGKDMTGPRYGEGLKFIIDTWERIARGRHIWESPERS